MHITEINIYPVKSLRGHAVDEATICRYGLENDRQWMLVDDSSKMITQRECPKLALLVPSVESGHLRIKIPDSHEIIVPAVPGTWTDEHVVVDLWGQQYVGVAANEVINVTLSEAIGRSCRLLAIRSDVFRTKTEVAFHDDAPILIISQASLDELNRRMPRPIPMNQFRPTLVVAGSDAFAEDQWERIGISGTEFPRREAMCALCHHDRRSGGRRVSRAGAAEDAGDIPAQRPRTSRLALTSARRARATNYAWVMSCGYWNNTPIATGHEALFPPYPGFAWGRACPERSRRDGAPTGATNYSAWSGWTMSTRRFSCQQESSDCSQTGYSLPQPVANPICESLTPWLIRLFFTNCARR